ncbi:MAG: alanine racemase [Clostridia bacterium]|nr:alanine racemase [Clostridia bacterium]
MNNFIRPTVMEVDLNAFKHNINQIQDRVGSDIKLMPVVKANAYGTYINTRIDVLNDFDIVAVAIVDEAVDLREYGYEKDIFILNQPYKEEIQRIIDNEITIGICEAGFIKELSKYDYKFKAHLEIDTGMGRTGIKSGEVEELIKNLPKNVIVEGIYTHFSSADFDDDYTKKQIEDFRVAVNKAKELIPDIKYIHASASDGLLFYPESNFNMVRPGIIMYGYSPLQEELGDIDLKPVAKLKSKITFLKTVESGTSIGYGRKYITDKETKIATIPIGYADGFRRAFSNNGRVLIDGKYAPIVGVVCMDSFMCDVTDIDCQVGDEVVIWDNENIKLEELSKTCDTINYEIISSISSRVPRVFI